MCPPREGSCHLRAPAVHTCPHARSCQSLRPWSPHIFTRPLLRTCVAALVLCVTEALPSPSFKTLHFSSTPLRSFPLFIVYGDFS